ncbi:MAG: nitroreductase family protein [Allobranchiibius sp.]
MTSDRAAPRSSSTQMDRAAVESVVAAAARAPSIHNTQPWRWNLHDGVLDVRADRSRQLHVADRDAHSLLISCGAAAELTGLALGEQGWSFDCLLMPDPSDPDLLARFGPLTRSEPNDRATTQLDAARERRSERRAFGGEPVTSQTIERLRVAAHAPGVRAHFPVRADESLELAVAISKADRFQHRDAAYAAEVAEWVRHDEQSPDGIPESVIPRVSAGHPRHTDIPLRDFEAGIPGAQLITAGIDEHPLITVILTDTDNNLERLRAGQAMMRLMIAAELDGLASCPLSQSVDLLSFRTQLRAQMSWSGHPQMMLRLGQKPTGTPAPLTARRPVADVLTITPNAPPAQPSASDASSTGSA